MRLALLPALLVLAACQTTAPRAPAAQPAVEGALAELLAVAAAPDSRPERFARFVADGADVTLAEVRQLVRDASAGGRFRYEVEEYVVEPDAGDTWHVLRVVVEDASGPPREVEFAFLSRAGAFRLGRIAR